jgi:hypothetical protein
LPIAYSYYNDLWEFDTNTYEWTWISGSNSEGQLGNYGTKGLPSTANVPGGRRLATSWIDRSNNNFWIFGGFGEDSVNGGIFRIESISP